MLAENFLSKKRQMPCTSVTVGSSEQVQFPSSVTRTAFRSSIESHALMKQRERQRLVANQLLPSRTTRRLKDLSTFPTFTNRNPPPVDFRRDDVTLPQVNPGPIRVIKFVDEALRHIFPPLPERTFQHLQVIPPETTDANVVDPREMRLSVPWEPHCPQEEFPLPSLLGSPQDAAAQRPQPVSPFKERTEIFDVFTPATLPKLLRYLSRGSIVKQPPFMKEQESRERPLTIAERAAAVEESSRRAAGSCPPEIWLRAPADQSRVVFDTTSEKVHRQTDTNRRKMRQLRAEWANTSGSSMFASFNAELSTVQGQGPVAALSAPEPSPSQQPTTERRKTFGNYLTA
jgi:hypothetical protein